LWFNIACVGREPLGSVDRAMTARVVLFSFIALLALAGAAEAQDWAYPRGYIMLPDSDQGEVYHPRHPRYWQEDQGYDSQSNYDYGDDPNAYYGDQEGDFTSRRRSKQQDAAIDPDQIAPELDSGLKDDAQAALLKSPISRTVVPFSGYAPGTIVISTKERRLYYVLEDGASALKYGIGVGKQGFSWKGTQTVSAKREWPDWIPPKEMIARRPELPDRMDGGLNNPLGARALYLGDTLYRIHGTNEPNSIGKAVSSGCIRMADPDVMDLYGRVDVGTSVVVL
jgi:lipoprotein-anchoring transpeptidase ErfK/SrfK